MKSTYGAKTVAALAVVAALGGCAAWHETERPVGTAAGAATGAVAGALVGGPVGAVVGGVGGAYVGHETTGQAPTTRTNTSSMGTSPAAAYDGATIRNVQQALNDRGYNVGAVDGQYGPNTMDAVRRFQQVSGLPATGELGRPTLNALGVS